MNKSIIVIVAIILVSMGYGAGKYANPAKVETKIVEVEKEKIVVKTNVVVKTKEIKRPDGTVITETDTTDKSTTATDIDKEMSNTNLVINAKPNYMVSGVMGSNTSNVDFSYGVKLDKRAVGNLFAGGMVMKNSKDTFVGISVGYEF